MSLVDTTLQTAKFRNPWQDCPTRCHSAARRATPSAPWPNWAAMSGSSARSEQAYDGRLLRAGARKLGCGTGHLPGHGAFGQMRVADLARRRTHDGATDPGAALRPDGRRDRNVDSSTITDLSLRRGRSGAEPRPDSQSRQDGQGVRAESRRRSAPAFNIVAENLEFLRGLVRDYVDIVFADEDEAKTFHLQPNR